MIGWLARKIYNSETFQNNKYYIGATGVAVSGLTLVGLAKAIDSCRENSFNLLVVSGLGLSLLWNARLSRRVTVLGQRVDGEENARRAGSKRLDSVMQILEDSQMGMVRDREDLEGLDENLRKEFQVDINNLTRFVKETDGERRQETAELKEDLNKIEEHVVGTDKSLRQQGEHFTRNLNVLEAAITRIAQQRKKHLETIEKQGEQLTQSADLERRNQEKIAQLEKELNDYKELEKIGHEFPAGVPINPFVNETKTSDKSDLDMSGSTPYRLFQQNGQANSASTTFPLKPNYYSNVSLFNQPNQDVNPIEKSEESKNSTSPKELVLKGINTNLHNFLKKLPK